MSFYFLESLEEILMEAIIEEKVEFVAMILQQTVVMKEFLTRKTLQTLYEKVSKRYINQKKIFIFWFNKKNLYGLHMSLPL